MRVKKGLRGGRRNAPSPDKKALDAVRPRVPVTLWLTNKPSKTQKRRGPTLRARGAPLALTRARGGRDHPLPTSVRSPTRASKSVAAKQNKRGKRKTRTREAQENPCRLASQKKASEGPRRIQKTRGAQKGTPRKTPRSRTHGQKRAKQKARRDTKKNRKTSACEGCPVAT